MDPQPGRDPRAGDKDRADKVDAERDEVRSLLQVWGCVPIMWWVSHGVEQADGIESTNVPMLQVCLALVLVVLSPRPRV